MAALTSEVSRLEAATREATEVREIVDYDYLKL